jgi:Ca2+/Na+ antiporter
MAAGASSPELFSSIVSLFITHSSLGLGTIVGSEIFNQLIICAGAVFASKNGVLALDKAIVTREVGFYALGIVLLYYALSDSKIDPEDPDVPHTSGKPLF